MPEVQPIIGPPCDKLERRSDGVIFRCKKTTNKELQAEMEIFLQSLGESLACWQKYNTDSKKAAMKKLAPTIQFCKFTAASGTETEDIYVFFCDPKGQRQPSTAEASRFVFALHLQQERRQRSGRPAFINALLPFTSSCMARISDVRETLSVFLEESIASMQIRARTTNIKCILPYDVSIEIHNNPSIEKEKDSLMKTMHERIGKCGDLLVYDKNFESIKAKQHRMDDKMMVFQMTTFMFGAEFDQKIHKNTVNDVAVLFKVTVFGDHAYFGVLIQPHAVNEYKFVGLKI